MIYRALTCRQRVHLWSTIGFLALGSAGLLASDNPMNPVKGGELVTIPNLVSVAGALLAAGTVWQQWQDAKAKLRDLDQRLCRLEDETLPATYVRKDVLEERLGRLSRGSR